MFIPDLILWSIVYVLGLGVRAIDGVWGGIPLPTLILSLGCVGAGAIVPRRWFGGPRALSWVIAGAIVWAAALNLYWQTPRPSGQDISVYLQQRENPNLPVMVEGRIRSIPTLNSSDRVRFELAVSQVIEKDQTPQITQGCLYTTVPILQGTGLLEGQRVQVTGRGYRPKPANNPAGFDFQQYLARQGCFAGLSGQTVTLMDSEPLPFGWWSLRQRILKAQVGALGSPYGTLVSAMVMGSQAVDLPPKVRQDFAQTGLAHTIAASGFHVTLLIGCVLWLTQGRSPLLQGISGFLSLIGFLGLTGPQPSIVRAVIMGSAGLLGLVLQRRAKPLGILSLAGILLLLIRPLWIWDLGFQLSFLATFGLISTATPLSRRLDFLPPRISSILAVPIAAMIWTLPILLYQFGVFSPYSLAVNILATPLVVVISLGGMISGLGAIVSIPLGTVLAQILYWPVKLLFLMVQGCLALPGSNWAVGSISLLQLMLLYGLFLLIWRYPSRQGGNHWIRWAAVGLSIALALVPNHYSQARLSQVTIVAGSNPPVLVMQNQGKTAIVNSGGEDTVRYTLLPYLQDQGVNRLTWAVSSENNAANRDGWLRLWQSLKVDRFVMGLNTNLGTQDDQKELWTVKALETALTNQNRTIESWTCTPDSPTLDKINAPKNTLSSCTPDLDLGNWQFSLLRADGSLWALWKRNPKTSPSDRQVLGFLLLDPKAQKDLLIYINHLNFEGEDPPWLWWTGAPLSPQLLEAVNWKWAAASVFQLKPETIALLQKQAIPLYWTGKDGALQWQPDSGIQPTIGFNDLD
jgi:competence protein ComEC